MPTCACRTTATSPTALRRHRLDRDVRGRGPRVLGQLLRTLQRQLKPGGRACIQTITIRDDLFERYVRSTDFIQQYIFPGGCCPAPRLPRQAQGRPGGGGELAFGADYAETLRRWRVQFLARDAQVRKLGFDTRFMRIWEFYLAYCEAAFATGNTDVMQFTLRRLDRDAPPGEIDTTTAQRWLAAMKAALPRREGRRPPHRRCTARATAHASSTTAAARPSGATPCFARQFFGIWLARQTSEPALRDGPAGP
jgi:hypothetical protein